MQLYNLYWPPETFSPRIRTSASPRWRATRGRLCCAGREHGIRYTKKTLGQLFCDGSARQIVDMLERECREAGVQILVNASAGEVRSEDGFT